MLDIDDFDHSNQSRDLLAASHFRYQNVFVFDDRAGAFLDFSPDAELGGDPYTTKASGGFWLELSSPSGERKWPISFGTKKATHTSGSTADSET